MTCESPGCCAGNTAEGFGVTGARPATAAHCPGNWYAEPGSTPHGYDLRPAPPADSDFIARRWRAPMSPGTAGCGWVVRGMSAVATEYADPTTRDTMNARGPVASHPVWRCRKASVRWLNPSMSS